MNGKPLNVFVFASFLFLATFPGITKSFAQPVSSTGGGDTYSDEQARENKAQQTLNQIHDLEAKMEENDRRLADLEKAVDQTVSETANTDTVQANNAAQEVPEQAASIQEVPIEQATQEKEVPAQAAAVEAAPAQAVVTEQKEASAPVQIASAGISPEERSMAEIKSEPAVVLPQSQGYYPSMTSISKEHSFELSQEDYYSSFKEPGNYNKNGAFYGLYGAYSFRPLETEDWPINVFHVDVHGDYGIEDYNYQGDRLRNVSDYIVEPRVWFGRDFSFGADNTLTPYVGFGYRWFYDRLKNKTDVEDDGGFNIQTQYFYIPVGAQVSVRPADGWRITLDSEYDFLAWGRVTDYLSDNGFGDPGLSNITNSVREGYGIQDSIKIIKEGVSVNYFVEPFVRYWNIKASNTVSVDNVPIQENRNHTTEVGARLGVDF